MSRLRFFRSSLIILLIASLAAPMIVAHADGTAFASISLPDTSQFPVLSILLDAFDGQGNFIDKLGLSNVIVLENGQQVRPDRVEKLEVPLNVVVAINSGPALSMRDGFGFSRYDKIAAVLSNWAAARPADSKDNISLTWNGGVIVSGEAPSSWKTRFNGFDPALRTSKPGVSALAFALDAAQQTPSVPGGKKSILLVSGHLDLQAQNDIKSLTDRAQQAGVRVYVWITDSKDFLTNNNGTLVLENLALTTGGRFLTFTGSETLPDPEEWLSPLRHVYKVSYGSQIRQGGQQTLTVQVDDNGLALTSAPVEFQLDVQPPSPVLLSPPIQIVRQNPDKPFDIESFLPAKQDISMLVEFPDGFKRPLARTTLYVDGNKVAENTSEPFNHFTWDLTTYVASGTHNLQVEAQDILGLKKMSAAIPVQVTVVQPPGGMAGLILRNRLAVTIGFLVLAGATLLGILFFGGRRTLSTLAERRRALAARLDPVTQPVYAAVETPGVPQVPHFPWLRRKTATPPAYFVKVTPDGQPAPGDPIPLNGHELTFGTDPTQSTNVLDHPSISALHARLRHTEDGNFILIDQNSVAGTWVNFETTPNGGRVLKHGDVVHFGKLTYRFVMTKPPIIQKPTITPSKDG